ncbi:MAG: toprim domain-containing protein [Verrucomicrobia bacterium]|nr:toprim domain-containing protein [Verrucomicrobiota bacterium]
MNAQQIADRLQAKSSGPDSWMARCPSHEDGSASLSIKHTTEKTLLHCFAGCPTDAVCGALGIKIGDLFTKPPTAPAPRRLVAAYDYVDEAGALLYQVVRFDPKDFRQRKPDGKNGWDWKIGDTRRVLFRLPDVVNAIERDATIFICEGEKDCLALTKIGLCSTCNAGGAESSPTGKKWLPAYTETLGGASVVILPDRDAPGRLHAQIVAGHLHGRAASVRIVELPDISGRTCKDAADFLAAGGTAEDIARIVESAPLFAGAPVADVDGPGCRAVRAIRPPERKRICLGAEREVLGRAIRDRKQGSA